MLGAEGQMLDCCITYGRILLLALPFFVLQLEFQSFFVTAELPQMGLFVTVASGVTNMVLDALLVILLPMEYKLVGAALASALSQTVGGLIPLIYFLVSKKGLISLGKTSFYGRTLVRASINGSSEFMSNVSMNLVGVLYNFQLMKYAGEDGIAAYGVMMYVSLIFAAAFIGYSIGSAPVVGFHDGAGNNAELRGIFKKSLVIICTLSVLMFALAEALAYPLSLLFVGYDSELLALTVSGFRIFSFGFLFMGIAIFASGFFTALNDGLTSALISFLRTLVFQVAAVMIIPLWLGINGVWLSIVVAEIMAVVFSAIFLVFKTKRFRKS